jgi:hypothetical protein
MSEVTSTTSTPDAEPTPAVVEQLPALSAKQVKFAFAYLRTGSAMKALREIGPVETYTNDAPLEERQAVHRRNSRRAQRLLHSKGMHRFLRAEKEKLYAAERMSTAEITARLARLGRVDPAEFFNEDGSYKQIHEIAPESRFCIAGWEDELRFEEDGAPPTMTRKIKIRDPHPSLRTLAQIEDLLDKGSVNVNLFLDLASRMDKARKRHDAERQAEEHKVVSEQ